MHMLGLSIRGLAVAQVAHLEVCYQAKPVTAAAVSYKSKTST